jgi:hypothetical protein
LEIIPALAVGVFVHLHDIFTPRDYRAPWITENVFFWNEQYLLEALLSDNPSLRVIAALNHLKHEEYDALKKVCPHLGPDSEPGSFYIETL